jgi:protein TonB
MRGGALPARLGAAWLLGLAASAAIAAAPHYWPAQDLDTRPQIANHVMPEYPADLPSGGRGQVVLDLYISLDGAVDRVRVVRAKPPGRFDASAVKAFSAARFTPGKRKGKPVQSVVRIEVTYGD